MLTIFACHQNEETQAKDARVVVESEDQPDRVLLETRICKEDGFQKQQGMSPYTITIPRDGTQC